MADNTTVVGGDVIATDDIGGVKHQLVKIEFGVADSATPVSSTNPLPVNELQVGNTAVNAFPAGFARVTDEPRQIFYDPFDAALDTANLWTTPTVGNSAVLASTTTGTLSLGTGTTASGWSKLTTSTSFKPTVPAWIGYSFALAIPDGAAPTANAYRFWGAGTIATVPTTAAPMTDAVGFELTTAGALCAVVYAGGTRTLIATLTAIGDAATHRYIVYIRTDRAYWYVDGLASTNLVATSNFQAPQVQTLPMSLLAVGGSTPPVSNAQIQTTGVTVWDTGKNATQLADGTYPFRKATIDANGALAVNARLAGVAASTGNGVAGTGVQRVTLASDNSAVPAAGQGATGAAVPAGATLYGLRAATANPTNATGGNLVASMGDKAGRTVVAVAQVRELIGVQQTAVAATTADQTIVTAGGSGVFNDITQLIITTAGAAAQTITIKDAAAGTTRLVLNYPNAATAPGAPLVIPFNPPLPQAASNTAWVVTQSLATACNYTVVFTKNT